MREIPLTKGMIAVVDDSDYDWLIQWTWFAKKNHKKYYAQRRSGEKHFQMHDMILPPLPGRSIDHINGNSLDNRKENLRQATQQRQCFNRGKIANTSSQYKGVSWHKGHKAWGAHFGIDDETFHIGYFDDEKAAALAYDIATQIYFGEYARTNFTDETRPDIQSFTQHDRQVVESYLDADEARIAHLAQRIRAQRRAAGLAEGGQMRLL